MTSEMFHWDKPGGEGSGESGVESEKLDVAGRDKHRQESGIRLSGDVDEDNFDEKAFMVPEDAFNVSTMEVARVAAVSEVPDNMPVGAIMETFMKNPGSADGPRRVLNSMNQ